MHRVPRGAISVHGRISWQLGLLALILACAVCLGCPDAKTLSSGSSAPAPADENLEGLWAGIYGSDPMDTDPEWDQDDQIVQGAGRMTSRIRLMMRGRDADDPLETVRIYTVGVEEVDTRDFSLSQALIRSTNISYKYPDQSTFGFIDDNHTSSWKANLQRMARGAAAGGEVTQFVPPETGTIPDVSSGVRDCTEAGSGAELCEVTFSFAQPIPLLDAFQLAGDIFVEDMSEPNMVFTADPDRRALDQAVSETISGANSSNYTEQTDAANDDVPDDVTVLPPNNRVSNNGLKGDSFYIGMTGEFSSFLIQVSTATGAGHEGVWEYSHYIVEPDPTPQDPDKINLTKSWNPLPGPSPTIFESTGLAFESWSLPDDWDPFSLETSGDNFHWIRFRTTVGDPLPARATRIWVVTHGSPYDMPSSLAELTGSWTRTAGDAVIDVAADGSFAGRDTGAGSCDYAGTFSIIDATKNLYAMTMEVTGCADFTAADYSGLAWIGVDPLTGTGDNLFFHVDNGNNAFADQFELTPP